MSDDGFRPPGGSPDVPAGGPPPGPPGAPGGASPDDTPVEPSRPPSDPTQVIPVVPTLPDAGGTPPPGVPGGPVTTTPYLQPDPVPPPRRSCAWVFGVGFVVVAILIGLLVWALSGDDGDGSISSDSPPAVSVVVNRVDAGGFPARVDLTAVVVVGDAGVSPYRWIVPDVGDDASSATRTTDSTGRTEFRWGPIANTTEPGVADWSTTVELREPWPDPSLTPPSVSCAVERDGEVIDVAATTGVDPVGTANPAAAPADGTPGPGAVAVELLNVRLRVGDELTCELRGAVPAPIDTSSTTTTVAPTTTGATTTTTVAETTTTAATTTTTTTVAPTTTGATTTTVAATTTTTTSTTTTSTTTTTTSTTSTTTTVPAAPPITDVLAGEADLGSFLALIEVAGLGESLDAPPDPTTVFAPTDAAMAQFAAGRPDLDLTDPAVAAAIVSAHLSVPERLDRAALEGLSEVVMVNGVPQPVVSIDPLVIGGATVERSDLPANDAVIHVLGAVLPVGI